MTHVAQPALRVERLRFGYDGTTVLQDIDLSVADGEFLALLGPSGSGKSTLLRLIAGLETPAGGRVLAAGRAIAEPGTDRAVVFQHYALFPWQRVVDNVAEGVRKARPELGRAAARTLASRYLARVGLGGIADSYPHELSGGMQQRAAIARALALESPFLLMDEPFGALDPVNRARLQDLLIEVWQGRARRPTVVFVTHDVDEALLLADRVAVLGASPGRVIARFDVPFERPRQRAALFADARFHQLREAIAAALDADTLARLEAA
jgi:NitT/TauT family transport system ATP-binding protein